MGVTSRSQHCPRWRRIIAAIGLLANVIVPIGAVAILAWAIWSMCGCGISIPHAPVATPPVVDPTKPEILKVLVPDTSETYWYIGLLAGLCFTVGVLAILASIFGRVIGFGLGGGSLLKAGLCCIVAGVGMAAVKFYLTAYLGVTVLVVVVLGAVALIPWIKTYFDWVRLRANVKKAEEIASKSPREAVAVLAGTNKKIDKVRKKVLEHLEAGKSVKEAIKGAV